MSFGRPTTFGVDDLPSPSTDSESGDGSEAGTPLRSTMDHRRVEAIDNIMQSFCAVLESKIALVRKTAVIKVEPDLDSSRGGLGTSVPIKSESKPPSPVIQRKGISTQPIPKSDYSPKPAALGTKGDHKKRSSFGPQLLPARSKQAAVTRAAPAPARAAPPPPAAPSSRRRSNAPTSYHSDTGPSPRTTTVSSLSPAAGVASRASTSGVAPPQAPAPSPAPAGAQRSIAGQATSVFTPFTSLNILHNQFFHLPPAQPETFGTSASRPYDISPRPALAFRAPAQSLQQQHESYGPDPTLERVGQIATPENLSGSGRDDSLLFRGSAQTSAPSDGDNEGSAERQDRAVAAQFQEFNAASDFSTAPGTASIQGFQVPPQAPPPVPALAGVSLNFDLGYGALTSTYVEEESFSAPAAPGSAFGGRNAHYYNEQHLSRSHHEHQFSIDSEPQPDQFEDVHFESTEWHAAVSETTPPKPITPKAPDRDGRRTKRQKGADDSEPRSGDRKFACPYYKRNRKKYSKWTSCPGPGWEEVHRVKTHLYRRHGRPPQCPRCWTTFTTDDSLHLHLQQNPPCETGHNQGLVEGFSKEQEKKLRSRKKAQPNMTDEDKWRDIYMILFPDDDKESIPTAYYDETDADADESSPGATGGLDDYASFVRREMPTLVRRELEVLFENEFKDVEERLRPRVAEIVLNLQPKLLDLYKQSHTPLSEYGPPPPEETPGSGSEPVSHSTGTDTNSTPGTRTGTDSDENVFQGVENSAYFNPTDTFEFDLNNLGTGFNWDGTGTALHTGGMPGDVEANLNWDFEFDRLLNPVLFSPPDSTEGGKRKYDGN